MKKISLTLITTIVSVMSFTQSIYHSNHFSVEADKVVQGNYMSKALSPNHLVSNYQSPANNFQSATIAFKFAINGRDNEMLSGMDHHFTVIAKNGKATTPVIQFGKQFAKEFDIDLRIVRELSEKENVCYEDIKEFSEIESFNINGFNSLRDKEIFLEHVQMHLNNSIVVLEAEVFENFQLECSSRVKTHSGMHVYEINNEKEASDKDNQSEDIIKNEKELKSAINTLPNDFIQQIKERVMEDIIESENVIKNIKKKTLKITKNFLINHEIKEKYIKNADKTNENSEM